MEIRWTGIWNLSKQGKGPRLVRLQTGIVKCQSSETESEDIIQPEARLNIMQKEGYFGIDDPILNTCSSKIEYRSSRCWKAWSVLPITELFMNWLNNTESAIFVFFRVLHWLFLEHHMYYEDLQQVCLLMKPINIVKTSFYAINKLNQYLYSFADFPQSILSICLMN